MLALPIAGEVLTGIENNGFLRGNYLTTFEVSDSSNVLIDCSPYQSKGLKGFIERLVKPEKQREQKVKKEIKRFFRKLFKKEQND
jgi:HKD family nuclease